MPAPCRARWITWPGSPPEEGASSCHVITWTKYQARGEQKCSSVNQLRMVPAGLVGFRDQVTHDQKPFGVRQRCPRGLSTSWVVRWMQKAGTSSLHSGGSSLRGMRFGALHPSLAIRACS